MTPDERIATLEQRLDRIEKSDRLVFEKNLQLMNGRNIQLGVSVGTKIGTVGGTSGQKLGFFGVAPVVQQPSVTAPSGGTTIDSQARAAISTLITRLQTLGLTL